MLIRLPPLGKMGEGGGRLKTWFLGFPHASLTFPQRGKAPKTKYVRLY